MKYLNERKSEDRVAFAYQYLNTAVRNADVGISPELIVKGEVPDDYDCLGVGIDLSAGLSQKNDWTVFTLGGIKDGKIYLIDQRRERSMGNIKRWIRSAKCWLTGTSLLRTTKGSSSQQCHRA